MALPINAGQGTADLSGIKAVGTPVQDTPVSNQAYQIPITQTLQKSDGTGTVDVVVQVITVTAQQLTQQIAMANAQIARATAQVADLQKKLDAINALATAAVTPAPVVETK